MHGLATLAALAAALQPAMAAFQGFNYGSTFTDGSAKAQADFESAFKKAASLTGTNGGFTSARLYTMIQGGTSDTVISAIPAAISTKTTLLLGLWASAGDEIFANELSALKTAISQFGSSLGPLVAGISVGSEDLYRVTPIGLKNSAGVGAGPDVITKYIKQVREAIAGTPLSGASIGHVDTWTAWVNSSNTEVINNCDWLGVDAYPYFQNTMPNDITKGKSLLESALTETDGVSQGKPVWITETGWPVSGDKSGDAEANTKNAKTYWDEVGCPRFGSSNVWWYTLQDADPTTPNPSFGVIDGTSTTPLFDLTCTVSSSSSSSSSSSTAAPTKSSTKAATTSATTSATAVVIGGGGSSSGKTSTAVVASSPAGSSAAKTTSTTPTTIATTSAPTTSVSSPANGTTITKVTTTPSTPIGTGSVGTTPAASSSPTVVVTSGAGMKSVSIMAAFAAVVAGVLAL